MIAYSFSAWRGLSRFEFKSNATTVQTSLTLSYTHTHSAHSHSTHTHTYGYLQHALPAPRCLIRSRGSQIRRLQLPVSTALKVSDSDSIQSKIIIMIITKGKKQRKEKESCGFINARLFNVVCSRNGWLVCFAASLTTVMQSSHI